MENFQIDGTITFLYYRNIEAAADFYRNTMGLEQVTDVSWVKIFKLTQTTHVGLVADGQGQIKASDDKPVMLSLIVSDVDAWYERLTARGIKANHEPRDNNRGSDSPHLRGFMIADPEGYAIEIIKFLTLPMGFPQNEG